MKTRVLSAPAVAPRRIGGLPISRLARDICVVLIIAGLLLVLDAAVTLVWKEPVTAVIATIRRSQIDQQFLSYQTAPLSPVQRHALAALPNTRQRIAFLARREQRLLATGDAIGRITIPSIGASLEVVQGVDGASLEEGPGHYSATALPGLGQTVAIAGHRATYRAPFRHLDALKPADRIVVQMPYALFTYSVQYRQTVQASALWVIRSVGYERLVLSAGNSLLSPGQRTIIFARLESVTPLGPARHA